MSGTIGALLKRYTRTNFRRTGMVIDFGEVRGMFHGEITASLAAAGGYWTQMAALASDTVSAVFLLQGRMGAIGEQSATGVFTYSKTVSTSVFVAFNAFGSESTSYALKPETAGQFTGTIVVEYIGFVVSTAFGHVS